MRNAAIRFRGKVYISEYHADCLDDCIQDPSHAESHAEIAALIDERPELVEFGREGAGGTFVALPPMDDAIRREWYVVEGAR